MINLRNEKSKPAIIFTHIPKTAGTTLKHIMLSQYKPQNVFEFYSLIREDKKGIDKFKNLSESRKKSIKLILGHIGFGLHEFLPHPHPYKYITMLRNPVNRVISYYHFLGQTNIGVLEDKTLEEFVMTSDTTQNNMTKYLSGAKLNTQLVYVKNQKELNCECNSKTLELAKKNLEEKFEFFGLLERFDESLILLKRTLGWNINQYLTRNVAKKKTKTTQYSQETIKLIEEVNEYDIELYQFAQKLFEERVLQYEDLIAREVEVLKGANQSRLSKLYFILNSHYTQASHKAYRTLTKILA